MPLQLNPEAEAILAKLLADGLIADRKADETEIRFSIPALRTVEPHGWRNDSITTLDLVISQEDPKDHLRVYIEADSSWSGNGDVESWYDADTQTAVDAADTWIREEVRCARENAEHVLKNSKDLPEEP